MSARVMVAFASALMSPWRAGAAASPPGPTTGPDESEARGRFDTATAAVLIARPVVMAAVSEKRLDAPVFLSVASCRTCAISPLTAGLTMRHHEMPLSLPESTRHTAAWYVAVNLPCYSGSACSHPGVVASSKRLRAEAALPGGRVHFHVNPASTRPRSFTSLRRHRGRGDFSGSYSSSLGHGRKSKLRPNLNYDVITLSYDQNGLRRNA